MKKLLGMILFSIIGICIVTSNDPVHAAELTLPVIQIDLDEDDTAIDIDDAVRAKITVDDEIYQNVQVKGYDEESWDREKKSYQLELTEEAELLEMGTSDTWVLWANSYDTTYLRNILGAELLGKMGDYQVEFCFTEVILNGESLGLYQLLKLNAVTEDIEYMLELDEVDASENDINTENGQKMICTYPKVVSEAVEKSLLKDIQKFEDAVNEDDFILGSPGAMDLGIQTHYADVFDMDSLVDSWLAQEIFYNENFMRRDTYLFKSTDGLWKNGRILRCDRLIIIKPLDDLNYHSGVLFLHA